MDIKKYEPLVKKAGEQLTKALKTAEEDIAKLYKMAETNVELQMKKLQKEKLYYDIGKYVAGKIKVNNLDTSETIKMFGKNLEKIDSESENIEKRLSKISAKKKEK